MKKIISIVVCLSFVISLSACGVKNKNIGNDSSITVREESRYDSDIADVENTQHSTTESEKNEIEEGDWNYPIKDWTAAQEKGLDFMGWKESCNPPDNVLCTLSSQKLAYLALRYPLFPYMPSGATDSEADVFIGVYEGYSTIFTELRNREDRNECILKEFAEIIPDIDAWNSDELMNESNWAEHFVEQYIFVFSKELTQEEIDFYLKTVDDKTEMYYSKIDNGHVVPGLSFDEDGTAYRKGYEGR